MQKLAMLHGFPQHREVSLGRFAFGFTLHFRKIVVFVSAVVTDLGVIKHVEVAFLAN